MRKIFRPSLEGARQVLENQLDLAEDQDRHVKKVVLTGGFGQSPSLQNYLQAYLAKRESQKQRNIELIVPNNPSVLRWCTEGIGCADELADRLQWPEVPFFGLSTRDLAQFVSCNAAMGSS
jgi:hypothetical protein